MRAATVSLAFSVLSSIGVLAAPLAPFATEVSLENSPTIVLDHPDDRPDEYFSPGQPDNYIYPTGQPASYSSSGLSISNRTVKFRTKSVTQSCSATDDAEYLTVLIKPLESTRSLHKHRSRSKTRTKHHLTEVFVTASPTPSTSELREVVVEETEVVIFTVTDSSSANDVSYPTMPPSPKTVSAALAARDEQDNAVDPVLADDDDGDDDDDDNGKSTKSKKHKKSKKSKKHHHHTKSKHETSTVEDSSQKTTSTVTNSPQEKGMSTSYRTVHKDAPKQTFYEEAPKQSCQPSTVSVYPSTQWLTLPPSTQPTAPSEDPKVQESKHEDSPQGSMSISYRTVKTIQPTDDGTVAHLAARETAAPQMSSKSKSKIRQSTKTTQPDEEESEPEISSQPKTRNAFETSHNTKPKAIDPEDDEMQSFLRSYIRANALKSRNNHKPKQTEEVFTWDRSSESKTGKPSQCHSSSTEPKQFELEDFESEGSSESKNGKASKTHHSSKTMSATELEPSGTGMSILYRTTHASGTKARPVVVKQTSEPDVEDDTVSQMLSSSKVGAHGTKTKDGASGTKPKARSTTKETNESDDDSK